MFMSLPSHWAKTHFKKALTYHLDPLWWSRLRGTWIHRDRKWGVDGVRNLLATWYHDGWWCPGCCQGPYGIPGPPVVMVCVYVHDSWCHWMFCWFQWPGPLPSSLFGSVTHPAAGAILIGAAFVAPGTMKATRPGLLPRTMSGTMIPPQPRSMLTPMCQGTVKGHMKPEVWATTYGQVGVQGHTST